jgi:YesN/AraC family two-component response regulator
LPIVLVSGYSGPLLTQQALATGVSELLTKPLRSREIATTLARILHQAAYSRQPQRNSAGPSLAKHKRAHWIGRESLLVPVEPRHGEGVN